MDTGLRNAPPLSDAIIWPHWDHLSEWPQANAYSNTIAGDLTEPGNYEGSARTDPILGGSGSGAGCALRTCA
jgi:hypothetical protein